MRTKPFAAIASSIPIKEVPFCFGSTGNGIVSRSLRSFTSGRLEPSSSGVPTKSCALILLAHKYSFVIIVSSEKVFGVKLRSTTRSVADSQSVVAATKELVVSNLKIVVASLLLLSGAPVQNPTMSHVGTKRTCRSPHRMSAFGGRADVSHGVFYEYTP